EQVRVYDEIHKDMDENQVFLLHGVTGSGKTEIYLNIIEDVLKSGKEAIMLVPEISLTPMMVSRFKGRFGNNVAMLHSALSIGEKYDEWRKIRRKEVSVVVGARSAIFAPFTNLGIIIIDEEHTDSYKQESLPMYHAKDVAMLRSKYYNIPLLLGSATPSVESYYNSLDGTYKLLEMKYRANKARMPEVYVEDMRNEFQGGNRSIFSKKLDDLMKDRLEKKEQIILLINRRGHSTFVMCRNCGEVIMCPNCDISLTFHDKTNSLKCHYCGHDEDNPTNCPHCDSTYIRYMGIGTEKVEEFVHKRFPAARIIRMDADTTTHKGAHEKLLYEFEHNGDILLGTQMISKGLDFPRVSLVGVLAADMSLSLPDYKAIEKTFQLLTQVSGRAGRHDILGEVVIQTYNPDHYAINFAKNHDYHAFYETEMNIREVAGYTPFNKLAQIIVSDKNVRKVLRKGTEIVMRLRKELEDEIIILGPVLPKIARINNYYRAQIIIKYQTSKVLDEALKQIYFDYNLELSIAIDKNPT
ncbi:MAG: primosomal protein N', partial [Candidatus Izimaplasma sp.]|nr:primosomal protein N' [Candidatus Izimaplasma bacterium]